MGACQGKMLNSGGSAVDDTVFRTMLFDFYGELLTEKQREYFDLHCNGDLSLAEIAAEAGISRQGVWDILRRAETALRDIEEKTGLVQRFAEQQEALTALRAELETLRGLCGGQALVLLDTALKRLDSLEDNCSPN
jgi:predicted DNA-binding protein YlxM (UPF0122 family)